MVTSRRPRAAKFGPRETGPSWARSQLGIWGPMMSPKCLGRGRGGKCLHSEREGKSTLTRLAGRRESPLTRGWVARDLSSQSHLSCPSQAEGGQIPLDAFQLPASVAHEDTSSPEPAPTGEPTSHPSPWEAPSGLWDLCCLVQRPLASHVAIYSKIKIKIPFP